MTDSADVQALLRTLVEQQTAFLNAQAESMRLQRVLVERLLGVNSSPPGTGCSDLRSSTGAFSDSESNSSCSSDFSKSTAGGRAGHK